MSTSQLEKTDLIVIRIENGPKSRWKNTMRSQKMSQLAEPSVRSYANAVTDFVKSVELVAATATQSVSEYCS